MDLIRTIEDDQEVTYASESDDSGDEAQPTLKKKSSKVHPDFETKFDFVSNQEEYQKDTWNDISKYLKKKAKTTLEDKIRKVRGTLEQEDDHEAMDVDQDLDEEDLTHDNIKVKDSELRRKTKKKAKEDSANSGKNGVKIEGDENLEDFFEEHTVTEEDDVSASFYNMNLSRPLLKAIESLNFVHPTPIQNATIPLALAGRDICGCAATGTGKTAAYMLPVLERLLFRPKESAITRVLVLVPTRELGVQVYQVWNTN